MTMVGNMHILDLILDTYILEDITRDGRDATDIVDQLNPNQPLAGPINLRLLADTIRKWTQLPKPVIISSANTEKTKQYARFLKLLKIPFMTRHILGHPILVLLATQQKD